MEVKYAVRRADNAQVVVKLQHKPKRFQNREEEFSWRHSTEFMLNLPPSSVVTSLYEVLEDDKSFYIITEKASGMDLHRLCSVEKHFTPHAARTIMQQILAAVAHLHEF